MIYEFGPDGDVFTAIGGGEIAGISNMVWLLLAMTLVFGFVFRFTRWGRHVYAVGGNEQAARLTGVPVNRIKLQTYISLRAHGGHRRDHDRRLAGIRHQCAGHGL